jgi:superfamily II DNA/RNA helicase
VLTSNDRSGKTLAFVLPMLKLLERPAGRGARALILVPTRELGVQIYNVVLKLTEHAPHNWQVCARALCDTLVLTRCIKDVVAAQREL